MLSTITCNVLAIRLSVPYTDLLYTRFKLLKIRFCDANAIGELLLCEPEEFPPDLNRVVTIQEAIDDLRWDCFVISLSALGFSVVIGQNIICHLSRSDEALILVNGNDGILPTSVFF